MAQSAQTKCVNLDTCPMFKLFGSESAGNVFRRFYCESNWSACERFKRGNEGRSVPDSLLPNGTSLAARG